MSILTKIIFVGALAGLLTLAAVRFYLVSDIAPGVVARVQERQERERPARLKAVVVTDSSCTDCLSVDPFLKALISQRVVLTNTKKMDYSKDETKKYLTENKIERLPVVILSGELEHHSELKDFLGKAGKISGTTFSYFTLPPYKEVTTSTTRGLFKTTYLTYPSCNSCYDVTSNSVALNNLGVVVKQDEIVDSSSEKGKELIEQYKIKYLPTVVLTGDLGVYSGFQAVWPQVGTSETGGVYVLRDGVKLMGTYYDLALKRAVKPATNNPS